MSDGNRFRRPTTRPREENANSPATGPADDARPTGPVTPGAPPDAAPSPSGPSPGRHPSDSSPADPSPRAPEQEGVGGSSTDSSEKSGGSDDANAAWSDFASAVGTRPGESNEKENLSVAPESRGEDTEAGGDTGPGDDDVADGADGADEAEAEVLDDFARLAAERDEYLDQFTRLRADFENFRRRKEKEKFEQIDRAAEHLVEKLLPVLDTFDMAVAHGEGFDQVHVALASLLEKEGLERIEPAGKPFDPNEADAVAHEEGDGGPVVAAVLRPGYRWKGRVLRPAMVKVRG